MLEQLAGVRTQLDSFCERLDEVRDDVKELSTRIAAHEREHAVEATNTINTWKGRLWGIGAILFTSGVTATISYLLRKP